MARTTAGESALLTESSGASRLSTVAEAVSGTEMPPPVTVSFVLHFGHLLSQNSHLPMGVFYVFVPITFGLTIFYVLVDMLGLFVHIEPADSGYNTDDELPEGQV